MESKRFGDEMPGEGLKVLAFSESEVFLCWLDDEGVHFVGDDAYERIFEVGESVVINGEQVDIWQEISWPVRFV